MRIPGRKAAIQWWRRTRGRWTRGVLILGYHRVSAGEDTWGISVSPDNFAGQMEVLARAARPLRLEEAPDLLVRNAAPRRSVVVTFDDGYADNLHQALPSLERTGVPATVFVVTGSLGTAFWWDELARVVEADVPVPDLEAAWSEVAAPPTNGGQRRIQRETVRSRTVGRLRFLESVAAALRSAPPDDRAQRIDAFRSRVGIPEEVEPRYRALTASELRTLARHGLIDIGSHTVTHPPLGDLSAAAQAVEVRESRRHLEEIVDGPIRSISYPNGSYSDETLRIVEEAEFAVGCCSLPDRASVHSNPYALPRLWVGDWPAPHFARWIGRWLHG